MKFEKYRENPTEKLLYFLFTLNSSYSHLYVSNNDLQTIINEKVPLKINRDNDIRRVCSAHEFFAKLNSMHFHWFDCVCLAAFHDC